MASTHTGPGPAGADIRIPATAADDDIAYPPLDRPEAVREFYAREGYVVLRGVISADVCARVRAAFDAEVKGFRGFIYRQASAEPERHVLTPGGFVLNSILNVHAVDPRAFPMFRAAGTALITSAPLQAAVRTLLGEPGTLVQSMYFEGNPVTWAHQDTYYLDSDEPGRMVGAWIALEEIHPGAGRFFVYPGSHQLDLGRNRGPLGIATDHDAYKRLALEAIAAHRLPCRAPALSPGDVLFWSSRTVHGSLATTAPERSRSSVTAHYIPGSTRLLQYQARAKRLELVTVNGMRVHVPKDLARAVPRLVFAVEIRAPRAFRALKRLAIRALLR